MVKKTAVAPLKKKEPTFRNVYLCFDPDGGDVEVSNTKDATKWYPYFIILRVDTTRINRPAIDLGTITLPE